MSDIQKADKKVTRNYYILLIIIVASVFFTQTEWFNSLVTIDKTDMNLTQLYEAQSSEFLYAQVLNIFFIVIMGFFGFRMLKVARQTVRENRYPPTGSKAPIDTKIVYGKKARLNAYLIFSTVIIFMSSMIFRSWYLYSFQTKFEDYAAESKEWERQDKINDEKILKHQNDFILANPKSPQSGYYLYQQGKLNEAESLINSLALSNLDKAIFAKNTMNINGELYDFNKEDSIIQLDKLCNEYVQACIFLARYFIEQRNFDEAFSKLNKIEHIDHPDIYSKLRWLYSVKTWRNYDKDKAKYYAKLFAKSSKSDCCESGRFSLTKY